jgi:hypothetical protein
MAVSLPPAARLPLAGAAISALVTFYSLRVYLPTLNTPHTSLEGVPHAPSALPPTPGLARRLALVVIDGLSHDSARSLEGLLPLRREGVFRSLRVDFPTFTSPALVAMITGLSPRDSGTRRNGDLGGVVGLDSVLDEAGDAGVATRLLARGYGDFAKVLGPPAGTPFFEGLFAPAVEVARQDLAEGAPAPLDGHSPMRTLSVVHWGEVDDAGHRHGGLSKRYRDEAENAAAFVARYARSLDLDQDSLVVVSDHGHLPEGGHGGDEPSVSHAFFLGVGGIFRRGVELGERPMRDVASTLAVIGGLRVPSSNLGLPMLDVLAIGDLETSFLLAAPFDQATRFACSLHMSPPCAEAPRLVDRLKKPDPTAWEEALALHAAIDDARVDELAVRRARDAPRRFFAALLVAVTALVLGLRKLGRVGVAAFVTPLLLTGAYVGYLWARGYRPTFSHLMPIPIFALDATPAGVVAVVAVALFAWAARCGRGAGWVLLAGVTLPFALLAAWVGADPITPPPNIAGALVFLLAPVVPSAAVAALILDLIEARRNSGEPSRTGPSDLVSRG